jgi:DNA replication protein DnaC
MTPASKKEIIFMENCRYLGLHYLAREYHQLVRRTGETDAGYAAFIQQVVAGEAAEKKERSAHYRIQESRLPKPYKLLEDFDFSFQPRLKKKLILDLATLDFLRRGESILFIGDPGTGKSHLARALGFIACGERFRVLYTTCSAMLSDLNRGVYENTLAKRLYRYTSAELLVIDEMGHDRLELEITKEAHLLFKVINERYNGRKPVIITSNIQESCWGDYLGDPLSTQALQDRIHHHSIRVEIKGPSFRKHEGEQLRKKYEIYNEPEQTKDNV